MDNFTNSDAIPLRHAPCIIVILIAAYLTVLAVGLVGNFFVIVVVLKMPKMKTATKYFILNLAIADLLVLLFCLVPSLIANIYVPWVLGSLMCKTVPYIQGVSVCASVYSLAAISCDRLMAIQVPMRRQVTKCMAQRIIVLIWIWAAVLASPWLLYFDLSNADGREPLLVFCIESWPPQVNGNIYFGLVNLGLFYLCPLAFISVCHLSIWLRVRHRQVHRGSPVSRTELERERTKLSVEKLVKAVVVGFATCWLPLYVIFVRIKLIPVVLTATEEEVMHYALPIAQWLGAANSCVNPILYAFFNRNFRCTLQRLLEGASAHTVPGNRPHSPTIDGVGLGTSLLSTALDRSHLHLKNSQLKNSCHSLVDPNECKLVVFSQSWQAIPRSQTY